MNPLSKPTPLSGYPEFLPAERVVEREVIASLSRTFELHGFANIETRAVEPLDRLAKGGEIEQEVYVLRRHARRRRRAGRQSGLGLHYDLTVPFARYVLENAGKLEFPFRRYQIQPAWRGERPQEGRYRQFNQADIDIVGRDELPFHHDVEVVRVMVEALGALPLPALSFQVNNRKLIQGFYRGLGIPDVPAAIRAIDKLDKQPAEAVAGLLVETAGATPEQAEKCLALATIRVADTSFVETVRGLGVEDELLETGLAELAAVRRRLRHRGDRPRHRRGQPAHRPRPRLLHRHRPGDLHGRLRAAEVRRRRRPLRRPRQRRPDDVSRRRRLLRRLPHARPARRRGGAVRQSSPSPARCSSPWPTRTRGRPRSSSPTGCAAAASRPRWPPSAQKYGKQIRYAERRGIPYVWFPPSGDQDERATRSRTSAAATRSPPTPTRGTHRPPTSTRRSPAQSSTKEQLS